MYMFVLAAHFSPSTRRDCNHSLRNPSSRRCVELSGRLNFPLHATGLRLLCMSVKYFKRVTTKTIKQTFNICHLITDVRQNYTVVVPVVLDLPCVVVCALTSTSTACCVRFVLIYNYYYGIIVTRAFCSE